MSRASTIGGSVTLFALALSVCACPETPKEDIEHGRSASPASASAKTSKAEAPATETPAAQANLEEEVGTEADFEEEAQTTLNADDISGELDKLEKEIGQ